MTKQELKQLETLLGKLRLEREKEIVAKYPEMKQAFEDNDLDAIYELDDGDCLIESIDNITPTVEKLELEAK